MTEPHQAAMSFAMSQDCTDEDDEAPDRAFSAPVIIVVCDSWTRVEEGRSEVETL